ncbi:MAG TPA: ABC transporter permease [Candidatus Kapabacteria bacterium]|nr:ABC transporter permease [Candidatus Kapabacteria bacterium]
MNKVSIIIRHEFRQKIRSKAFIIMTLLAPALLALLTAIPILITLLNVNNGKHIVVVDATTHLSNYFTVDSSIITKLGKNFSSAEKIKVDILSSPASNNTTLDSVKHLLGIKQIDGYFIIPEQAINDTNAVALLKMNNTNDLLIEDYISSRYGDGLFTERMRLSGIDANVVRTAQHAHKIETVKVAEGKEARDNGIGFAAGYICGFFIYLSMILYGSLIMQSVIEEKSTRVIELLASSVRPIDILIGKVIGVGAAGLLQVMIWAIMFALVSWFALPAILTSVGTGITTLLSPVLFIYFILYFLFGYLIFSTLYAAAGATVEQASDAQQVTLPITVLIIIPFITISTVIQSPSSTLSIVLSLIPFFSPILMIGRIFSETPPFWQILLSFVLMGATFFGVLWFASKIYRTGILMYGKKFTLREIVRWVRYS